MLPQGLNESCSLGSDGEELSRRIKIQTGVLSLIFPCFASLSWQRTPEIHTFFRIREL